MKYRPNYPGTFGTLDEARAFMARYVPWYNAEHKHSGIALFSPNEVHDGTWKHAWARREHTQQAYYDGHPERFRRRPSTPLPAGIVGVNQIRMRRAIIKGGESGLGAACAARLRAGGVDVPTFDLSRGA